MVGDRDAVVRKYSDADDPAFDRDVVDVEAMVVIDRGREISEIWQHPAGIEPAFEYFGEAGFVDISTRSVTPALGIMHRKSGVVEVALELKSRLLDKILVLGVAGNGGQLAGRVEGSNPIKVDVEESICSRQQPCCLGRSVLAEGDDKRDYSDQRDDNDQDGEAASNAH